MRGRMVFAGLTLSLITVGASAQSFNVDVGTATAGGAGFGAPASTHGGAASQVGFWNNITGLTAGPFALSDLSGAATAVTLSRTNGTGGNFGFNNTNTTGDYQALLDDGQDIGGPAAPAVVYTFNNLAAGIYNVYSYAVAPDSAAFVTSVTVAGNTQNVGGAIPLNAYAVGITHALHSNVNHAGGAFTITFDTVTSFGTVNGIQLVLVPTPGAMALIGLAGLIGPSRRRR